MSPGARRHGEDGDGEGEGFIKDLGGGCSRTTKCNRVGFSKDASSSEVKSLKGGR